MPPNERRRRPRPRLELTNAELAEMLNITQASVSRIRNGTRFPSFDVMVSIETVLKWPLAEQLWSRREGTYPRDFESKMGEFDKSEHPD